jgi:hypothetical protein
MLLVLLNIKEKRSNGKSRRIFSKSSNKITILALDSNRYRDDLEVLAKNKKFRVLYMTQRAPGWLLKSFYNDNELKKYINSEKGSDEENNHSHALNFMIDFLRYFYSYVSVDCVTTVNYRYIEDYNWAKASNIIGVSFIMLYRECLLAVERIYDKVYLRTRDRFGKFHGEHIIVHNQISKELFSSSGYCSAKDISVCGALRMDNLLKILKKDLSDKGLKRGKKTFTLFYFPHNISMFGRHGEDVCKEKYKYHAKVWKRRDDLFTDLHNSIIELAKSNPDIDFVIKPKKEMMNNRTWEFYENIVKNSNIDVGKLSNYKVLPDVNVHQLIMESDIICALQSSTVLESALAKKRVIFPLFYQFIDTPYLNNFSWNKHIHLFDVAKNKSHFKRLFYEVLDQPHVDRHVISERIDLFETYFDSYDGVAFDKYSKVIESVVDNKKYEAIRL